MHALAGIDHDAADFAGARAQHLHFRARRQPRDAFLGQQDAQGEGRLEPVLEQAGVDQHGDEHADAGEHHNAYDFVELIDAEDRALHRDLRTRTSPLSPSRNRWSDWTNCAACAARLVVIHSTVAPLSHAAEIARAIGTASSDVWSSI